MQGREEAAAIFTFDEMGDILDEAAETLPEDVFIDLNGGVCLLPDVKQSPEDLDGSLYTLGEYRHNSMGRYINIYAGSILENYPNCSRVRMRRILLSVLKHELTHHLESMAGERDLEIEDERRIDRYRRGTAR